MLLQIEIQVIAFTVFQHCTKPTIEEEKKLDIKHYPVIYYHSDEMKSISSLQNKESKSKQIFS